MVLHKTVVLHIMLFPSLLNFCYFLSSHAQTSLMPHITDMMKMGMAAISQRKAMVSVHAVCISTSGQNHRAVRLHP